MLRLAVSLRAPVFFGSQSRNRPPYYDEPLRRPHAHSGLTMLGCMGPGSSLTVRRSQYRRHMPSTRARSSRRRGPSRSRSTTTFNDGHGCPQAGTSRHLNIPRL